MNYIVSHDWQVTFSTLGALGPICLRITRNGKKDEPEPRGEALPRVDDIIAPTEQERRDRVHYATGGPGGIPRWARVFKAREERERARVHDHGK